MSKMYLYMPLCVFMIWSSFDYESYCVIDMFQVFLAIFRGCVLLEEVYVYVCENHMINFPRL